MPAAAGKLYLGLDSSTQSLTALVLEVDGTAAHVAFEASLNFDEVFPHYDTHHGVLPQTYPDEVVSSPVMWAEALEVMLQRVAGSGLDISRLAAVSGSAQQHGSVYMNGSAERALAELDAARPLAPQIQPMLSRAVAPVWLDSSTSAQCAEITNAVGGSDVLAR